MLKEYLPIFVFFLLFIPIIYFILTLPTQPQNFQISQDNSEEQSNNQSFECVSGDVTDCTNANGCNGLSYCKNGFWGNCVISKICEPGSKKTCWAGCSEGSLICNECGTNYSTCIIS